jgi:L-fuconolactonase
MTTIDAHQHFWDPARADYPWMTEDLAVLRRAFGPDDLRPLLVAERIERTVLVQTRSSFDETLEFLALAERESFVAGIVGWIDLTGPAVADDVARLRAAPGGRRLVGIRHQVHDEDDPGWLSRPDVRRGLASVERAGLPFDLLVRPRELPAALDLARSMPGLALIVDHIAKPPIVSGELEPWLSRLLPLARLPNVTSKASGMVTLADPAAWTAADLRPYVEAVVEMFGPDRLMFGSDWPVCLLAASYAEVVGAARDLFGGLSGAEQARIFGGTALEAYRLAVG